MAAELVTCRQILSMMIMLSYIFQYMIRSNISIAIIAMTSFNTSRSDDSHFTWSEEEKNNVLGIYFFGYLLTAIVGGRLSEIYGSKMVIGFAMLMGSVLTLLTPLAATVHYYCLLATRAVLGLCFGGLWPSTLPIAARWVPVSSRSRFVAQTSASALGVTITLPICGFLIANFGWESVFYVTGTLPLVWTLFWFYLVHDTPQQHPRISNKERLELERRVPDVNSMSGHKIPWIKIISSGPVWAIIVANTGLLLSYYFAVNELPTYLHQILRFEIRENGILSSLPFAATYLGAVVSCYCADKWIKNRTFRVITVRKLFCGVVLLGPACFFLVLSIWGYNRVVSVVTFTLCLFAIGFYTSSYYANCLDIAPAFSGTIFGFANTFGSLSGYASTKMVAVFTKDEQTFQQWRSVYWCLSLANVLAAIFYFYFASAEVQSWHPESPDDACTEELNSTKLKELCKIDGNET